MIRGAVFVPAVALQSTFHSPAIFEESWEYAKNVFTCFVDLEKAYSIVPCAKLWGVFRECGVASACYWRSIYCIPAQNLSVSGEFNHDRSPLFLNSDRGVCCHHSFS